MGAACLCHSPQSHSVDHQHGVSERSIVCRRALYHVCKFEIYVYIRSLNLSFRYMATRRQTYQYIHTHILQCSHASVGLAQLRLTPKTDILIHTYTRVLQCSHSSVGLTQACPKLLLHMLKSQVIACYLVFPCFCLAFLSGGDSTIYGGGKTVKADRKTRGGGIFC